MVLNTGGFLMNSNILDYSNINLTRCRCRNQKLKKKKRKILPILLMRNQNLVVVVVLVKCNGIVSSQLGILSSSSRNKPTFR